MYEHSLPHPEEHSKHYRRPQPSSHNVGYQTESQRLFSGSMMSDGGGSFGDEGSYGGGGGQSNYGRSQQQQQSRRGFQSTRSGFQSTRSGFQQSIIEEGEGEYYEEDGEYWQGDEGYYGEDDQFQGGGQQAAPGPRFRAPIDNSGRSGMSGMSDGSAGRGGNNPPQSQSYYYGQSEANLSQVNEEGEYYDDQPQQQQGTEEPSVLDRRAQFRQMSGRSFPNESFNSNQQSQRSFQPSQPSTNNSSFAPSGNQQSMRSFTHVEEEEENLPVSPLRQLLDAINMSILPTSLRLSSLAQAVEFFDHRERSMHDAELREGGAFVLYHKLGLVLRLSKSGEAALNEGMDSSSGTGSQTEDASSKKSGAPRAMNHYISYQQSLMNSLMVQQQSEFDKEIAMICSCLEMVHRANPDAIAQTWDECGTEILPLLVTVLERPFQKIERAVWLAIQEKANVPGSLERAVATAVTRDQKLAVQKVTKVLAMYSLVPEAKQPMCDQPGMLRWLTRIVDTHNFNRVKPGAPPIGGMASGGSLDGDGLDAKQAKRLEMATRATSGSGLYMTEAARFNTIATLTNLAAHEANRMPMLQEPGLLDNICRAVHNERSDVPKQCAALAIMNMSNGDMDNVPEMARNDLVLETLLKLMKEDNPETRRNAVVTIFNVACSDQNTIRLARYRDGTILEALVDLVGSDDPILRNHDEARANAAETLFNMSCSEISETTDRMANHAGLLECLAVTLRGENTGLEVKMYCSATLRRMAEIIKAPMIAQGALLSALVKAATWTSTDCIAEAFRAQAAVPENCFIMANHHGLLNALSRLALTRGEGQEMEKVRMASCLAIELMSRQDDARALLSQNEGIIMALTQASYDDQGEGQMRRRSTNSEEGSGGFLDGSGRSGRSSGEYSRDDDDDNSMQSRRIQVALKNLVAAM